MVAPGSPIGVDLGLTHLATLSTGELVEPPQFLREGEERLVLEQRRLARKRPGSHGYRRQIERVGRVQARIRRQRRWFAHQVSHDLCRKFDLVAFEDLDIAQLVRRNPRAKGILDAGWGMLREMTAYKERLRSGRCLEVPSSGTTQTCSACGRKADPPLPLRDRTYRCVGGFESDRDVNAAKNVRVRGIALLAEELRRSTTEETLVESGPPPKPVGRRAYQRRRAGSMKRENAPGPAVSDQNWPFMVRLAAPFPRPATACETSPPPRPGGGPATPAGKSEPGSNNV